MIICGIYNSHSLETLIDTVHRLHNQTTWNEQLFAGKIDNGMVGTCQKKEQVIMPLIHAVPYHGKGEVCQNI